MIIPTVWTTRACVQLATILLAGLMLEPATVDAVAIASESPPKPAVIWAAMYDVETLERWIQQGVDLESRDEAGQTALFYAGRSPGSRAHEGARLAYLLIEGGADVNVRDDRGRTPLMWASQFGHAGVAALLLAAGADHTAADESGWTALMYAIVSGDFLFSRRAVREAYGVRDEPNGDGWVTCFMLQYVVTTWSVDTLLLAGADVNARNAAGWTPLMLAAVFGWYHHDRDTPPEVRLTLEESNLIEAAEEKLPTGYTSAPGLARRLLAHGADPTVRNGEGMTALDIAKQRRDPVGERLVEILEAAVASWVAR